MVCELMLLILLKDQKTEEVINNTTGVNSGKITPELQREAELQKQKEGH